MQEYLVKCRDRWWHFFIRPLYGLCFKRREGGRFLPLEVLLPEACEDFCAQLLGDEIHIVCQDKNGNLLHLQLTEDTWHKTVLLESKSPAPYPKYFSLIPMGNFLNLFYVIAYREKHMLVHQILTGEDRPPTVIDRITLQTPPFIAASHTGTDITVLYENEAGVSGSRLYRWSRKEFGRFVPVNPALACRVRGMQIEDGDRVRYAALQHFDTIQNLVYFEKTAEGSYTQPVTVYLDCSPEAAPVFCRDGQRLYLLWRENGVVMSSYSTDDGGKWSKPLRYMQGASVVPVCYVICENGAERRAYGYEKEQEPVLYAMPGLLETTQPPAAGGGFRPAGYDAEVFAARMGALSREPAAGGEPLAMQLREELLRLKEQFMSLRQELAVLKEQLPQKADKPEVASAEKANGGVAAQLKAT